MIDAAALFALLDHPRGWYALPLIVAISLVYGATRHEDMRPILLNAYRAAIWIMGFMLIIFGILFLVSWLYL